MWLKSRVCSQQCSCVYVCVSSVCMWVCTSPYAECGCLTWQCERARVEEQVRAEQRAQPRARARHRQRRVQVHARRPVHLTHTRQSKIYERDI